MSERPDTEDIEGRGPLTAVILAGERGGANPVAEAAGVAQKCWAPVAGVPMLLRVVDSLRQSQAVGRIAVSLKGTPSEAEHRALTERAGPLALTLLPSADSPSASILAAVESLEDPFPLLITTADHPLLTAAMVDRFWTACAAAEVDVAAALTPAEVIQSAYPETRRTYLKFADGGRSGANLFALPQPEGLAAVAFWRRVERNRKRPWRLASAFGLGTLLAYVTGRLTLGDAARRASRILGVRAALIDLPFAEAAIDVDKPSDLALVERILRQREEPHVPAGTPL